MRFVVFLCLTACARPLPPAVQTTAVAHETRSPPPAEPARTAARTPIEAPVRSADELIDESGVARFLATSQLKAAALDADALERWYLRKPRRVFVYAERPIEVAESGASRRPQCQPMQREDDVVVNELSVVLWQKGQARTVLQLGQSDVNAVDQARERGEWTTLGVRQLPMKASAWTDGHLRYTEGAALHEVACVPALRAVPCGEQPPEARGYCVDHDLVVRPWQAPTVLATGRVIGGAHDSIPDVPEGDCAVHCKPSACEEALRRDPLPQAPLYAEDAPVLAAFKSEAACRAFRSARTKARSNADGADRIPW